MEVENFPDELLEKILSYYSYDEISRLRLVCKKFDRCCQRLLNQGFLKVEKFHAQCLRNVKAQLPRRESERRTHLLARHCDILTAIETRLSLLGMTFMKYVDMNLCCFIPGKVIDEIYRVLRCIQNTTSPPRAHEILQELRDISSMAMEHFDEKIVPSLKQKIGASSPNITMTSQGTYTIPGSPSYSCSSRPGGRTLALREEITKLHQFIKQLSCANVSLKKEVVALKGKLSDQRKKLKEQKHVIADQNARIVEQEGKINEINRKLLEYDRHFADILSELNRSHVGNSPISEAQPYLAGTLRKHDLPLLPNLPSCDEHSSGANGSPQSESCNLVQSLQLPEPSTFSSLATESLSGIHTHEKTGDCVVSDIDDEDEDDDDNDSSASLSQTQCVDGPSTSNMVELHTSCEKAENKKTPREKRKHMCKNESKLKHLCSAKESKDRIDNDNNDSSASVSQNQCVDGPSTSNMVELHTGCEKSENKKTPREKRKHMYKNESKQKRLCSEKKSKDGI